MNNMFLYESKQHDILTFYYLLHFLVESPEWHFWLKRGSRTALAFFGNGVRNRHGAFSRAAPADLSDVAGACVRLIASQACEVGAAAMLSPESKFSHLIWLR